MKHTVVHAAHHPTQPEHLRAARQALATGTLPPVRDLIRLSLTRGIPDRPARKGHDARHARDGKPANYYRWWESA